MTEVREISVSEKLGQQVQAKLHSLMMVCRISWIVAKAVVMEVYDWGVNGSNYRVESGALAAERDRWGTLVLRSMPSVEVISGSSARLARLDGAAGRGGEAWRRGALSPVDVESSRD